MRQVEIAAAAADLHGLIDRVRSGEDVILVEAGQQLVKIVSVLDTFHPHRPRVLGRLQGLATVPQDFDAPLPEEVLDLFEGKP